MSWIRIDDGFISHPKTLQISHKAVVLHLAGLSYCSVQLSDGKIPAAAIPMVLAQARVTRRALGELRDVGMWRDQGEHWEIHDYLDFQESRETVLARREKARQRKAKSRAESRRDTPSDSAEPSHDTPPLPSPPMNNKAAAHLQVAHPQPVDERIIEACEMFARHRASQEHPRNVGGFIRSIRDDELALNGDRARVVLDDIPDARVRDLLVNVWGLSGRDVEALERSEVAS